MGTGSREVIYVMDKGKQYACKIVERNEKGEKIKVHFVGWNKKCDIWLDEDSDRIVPSPNDRSLKVGLHEGVYAAATPLEEQKLAFYVLRVICSSY